MSQLRDGLNLHILAVHDMQMVNRVNGTLLHNSYLYDYADNGTLTVAAALAWVLYDMLVTLDQDVGGPPSLKASTLDSFLFFSSRIRR